MASRPRRKLMGEINVVPYIDVMLVLLIIFMVTAPMLTQGIQVELPQAGAEPLDVSEANEPLVLSIDRDGRFYLNVGADESVDGSEQMPVDADRVQAVVAAVLRRNADTPVLVKADRAVDYGSVVDGMVRLQSAGARQIGFMTDPLD